MHSTRICTAQEILTRVSTSSCLIADTAKDLCCRQCRGADLSFQEITARARFRDTHLMSRLCQNLSHIAKIHLDLRYMAQSNEVPLHHPNRRGVNGIVTDISLVHETAGRCALKASLCWLFFMTNTQYLTLSVQGISAFPCPDYRGS